MDERLRTHLLALQSSLEPAVRLSNDPVRFVHRYTTGPDQEIAGFFAATLAYGSVRLFSPVIARLLDEADRHGGPREWLDTVETTWTLHKLYYRFHRAGDLLLLARGLGSVVRREGSLGALVRVRSGEPDVGPALSRMVQVLREEVVRLAPGVETFGELPRGVRYSLVDPASGSATKRLLMFARWMVRRDEVDRGWWTHVSPAHLIMPVDTHVHRISRMTGLIQRRSADWRTAVELTAALRRLDPEDPVRFDFALAHVGISQGCTGKADVPCETCALRPLCEVG